MKKANKKQTASITDKAGVSFNPLLSDSILPMPMLYLGNSKWTSANRNMAVHIANTNREPLCGKQYKNGALDIYKSTWEYWVDEVTCEKCKAKYFR